MRYRTIPAAGVLLLLLLVLPSVARGSPEIPGQSDTWGSATGYSTVVGYELLPQNDQMELWRTSYGAICVGATTGPHEAFSRVQVPEGARLTFLRFWAVDNHPDDDLEYFVYEHCQPLGDTSPVERLIGHAFTISDIGEYSSFTPLDDTTVNNRDCVYTVKVRFSGPGGACRSTQLTARKHQILWVRQVRPAPATATFADVPVGHQQFAFVEALATSGITAGCGGGNFCPDMPLTRGQMAVFLSAALGLHWPN
jgi:hypothetical protein